MKITLHTINLDLPNSARTRMEQRITSILSRLEHRILHVRVRVEDINGPKGGIDHRCQIEVQLKHGTQLIVEARDVENSVRSEGEQRTSVFLLARESSSCSVR